MEWSVWQEIYAFYEEPQMCELNDNNGQTIEVDLCESVKNAIVVKDTMGADNWIEMTDSYEFFLQVCLDPVDDAWTLHYELSSNVYQNLARRNANIHFCKVVGIGATMLSCELKGHSVILNYSASLGEIYRDVRIDGELHKLGNKNPEKKLEKLLNVLEPVLKPIEEVNMRPVHADEEEDVDIGSFDKHIPIE